MRTTVTRAWRPALASLAICSWVGLQACSSGGTKSNPSEDGGSSGEDTGGKSGSTGGKSGGTGGKAATGGSSGSTGGSSGSTGGSSGSTGGSSGSTGGSSGSTGGMMGSTGGMMGGTGGMSGGMTTPPAGTTKIAQHVITFYSFQDNTPVNSLFTASGKTLHQFSSVAVPHSELSKALGGKGTLNYGDKLWLQFLAGRTMPNGTKHTGWVSVDDFCGDGGDDSYCFQQIDGKGPMYPNVDLYIGDFSKSGFMPIPPSPEHPNGDCTGPSGSGQDLTDTYTGKPATFETNYGGALLGTGKCGDRQAARDQQFGPPKGAPFGDEAKNLEGTLTACWGYDGQGPDTKDCAMCVAGVTCAP